MVVIVNGFPRLSETFVLHELLDLERRGTRLHIVALRRPEETIQQEALSELRADVTYVPDLTGTAARMVVRAAHGALLLRRRSAYLDGLARVVASPDFSRSNLDRSAVIAHHILRLGAQSIYIHFAHKPATLGRFAALLSGLPYGISAHAKDIWCTPDRELSTKVRDARVVLTCTEEGRARLAELAGGRTPVVLAMHGVETDRPARPDPRNAVPVVLSVGRLVEKKGHDSLIRAAAMLRDEGVDFRLRIAGEGPDWPTLQRLVHELCLADRVAFLGPLTPAEVELEYAGADVFALACRRLVDGDRDGIPNVVLEAMAQGTPVVLTETCGIAADLESRGAALVTDGSPGQLADAVARVLAEPGLGESLAQRGLEAVRTTYGISAVVDSLESTYAEAVKPCAN